MRTMLALPLLLVVPALAGPLNPQWVSASADWVVHIDVEALAGSAIGRYLRNHDQHPDLRKAQDRLDLDFFKDIKSLTVYGTAAHPGDGVVIVAASDAVDASLQKIKAEAEYQTQDVDGTTFHIWTDTRGHGGSHFAVVRPGEDASQRVVFIGESREQVLLGLGVVDGEQPARAPTDPAPASGSLLFVHARELPGALCEDARAGRFMKLVQGVLLDIGEGAGRVYADLTLTAATTQDAVSLAQAAQGFLAMGRLMAQDRPGVALCESIVFATEGNNVSARWKHEIEALIGALEGQKKEGNADADSPNKAAGAR